MFAKGQKALMKRIFEIPGLCFAAAIAHGALVGFGRITQGGLYLSDLVFAFFFVYLTARANLLHHV